jgi:hypothetical protein
MADNKDEPRLEDMGDIFSIPTRVEITERPDNRAGAASQSAGSADQGVGESGIIQGVATGLGAAAGWQNRAQKQRFDKLRMELNAAATSQAETKKMIEEFLKNQGDPQAQSNFERAIQGAREDVTGTTGRARGETYNTEEARRSQVRRGVNNPFTQSAWGATDQGVLAPPQVIENRTAQQAAIAAQETAKAQEGARMKYLKTLLASPVTSAADYLARSRLLGALSGGMTAYEAFEAYQAAKEGRLGDAASSGLSALGGAISMIPTVPTVLAGGALAAAPYIYKTLTEERPQEEAYRRPVTEQDVAMASRPAYGMAPSSVRSLAARRGPTVVAGGLPDSN